MLTQQVLVILAYTIYRLPQSSQMLTAENWARQIFIGLSSELYKQWGNLWAGYTEVLNWYFPLTTSQVYAVCLTKHTKNISSGHNWEPARIEEWNNSYARIHPDGDLGYSVIAICKAQQQWGFTVFDPVDYKNVNFTLPLSVNGTFCAFSTGYDPKGSTFLWHSMSHFNNVNVGVTGFVFDSRYTFTGLGYLAVCWQKQWGINTGGAVRTSTLPIPFTKVFLAVASTSSEWCCPGCSATNTTVTTRAYQSNRPDVAQPNDVNWIIIGCQPQWGYCSSRTATFPIPFPASALFIVAVPKTTSTSATATGAEYLGTTSVNLYLHGTSGWYFVGGH